MPSLPTHHTALDAAYTAALHRQDHQQADLIERALDAGPRPITGTPLLPAALWYATQGLSVFPLRPLEKTPATRHGLKDATTDPDQIRAWWDDKPDANVAIRTGDRFDVIDVDGPAGHASIINQLRDDADFPPLHGVTLTPTGQGMHLWVDHTGRGNRAGYLEKVDYRGAGGYVVAPPSRIAAGQYLWVMPLERTQ